MQIIRFLFTFIAIVFSHISIFLILIVVLIPAALIVLIKLEHCATPLTLLQADRLCGTDGRQG